MKKWKKQEPPENGSSKCNNSFSLIRKQKGRPMPLERLIKGTYFTKRKRGKGQFKEKASWLDTKVNFGFRSQTATSLTRN